VIGSLVGVIKGETKCIFWRYGVEDRDRLFFCCSYSKRIWLSIMQLCGLERPPVCWDDALLEWVQNWRRKVSKTHVCRLALGLLYIIFGVTGMI
jgi:hypothetical protein